MGLKDGSLSRTSVYFLFGMLTFALGLLAVVAQHDASPAMSPLARQSCDTGATLKGVVDRESGFVPMLGLAEKDYSFRSLRHGTRALMIPAEFCRGPGGLELKTFQLVISHAFQNKQGIREGFYYLTNQNGELLNAVHFLDGRPQLFSYANQATALRRADFEAEKELWLSRIAALQSPRRRANAKPD